jgi:hypothetical protein
VLANPSRQAWSEKCYLRFMPNARLVSQKSKRLSYAKLPLMALMEHKPASSERVLTGDQSWFILSNSRDSAWTSTRDDFGHRIKPTMGTEKYLVSIV